jgi:hypothetical protein
MKLYQTPVVFEKVIVSKEQSPGMKKQDEKPA